MRSLTKIIDNILSKILIILMALMVLDVTWQVFTRFIMRDPSSFTEEVARFLLIWIGILGAAYALRTRAHLGIDILQMKLQGVQRRTLDILVYGIITTFSLFVMVIGGTRLVQLVFKLNQISAALGIKMGYVYLVLPISGVLMIYYSLGFIIDAIAGRETEAPEQKM